MLKKGKAEREKRPPSSSSSSEESQEEDRGRGGRRILIKEDRNKFHTFGKEQRQINRIDEQQEEEESSSYDGNQEEQERDENWSDKDEQENSYDSDVLESKKQQPVESDEEESMDYIEHRIKKLEAELEEKLLRSRHRPPIPSSVPAKEELRAMQPPKLRGKRTENLAVQTSDLLKKEKPTKPEAEIQVPKQTVPRPSELPPPAMKQPPPKTASPLKKIEYNSSVDEYRRQAEQLKYITPRLRKQNDKLRKKLRKQEANKRGLTRERIEVVELQKIVASAQATKLEKQLELIDILEAIKNKLKRSISKKIAKLNDTNEKQRSLKQKAQAYLAK